MKVCILGATGLLGKALVCEAKKRYGESAVVGVARRDSDINLDVTSDEQLEAFFAIHTFTVVINTVAIVHHRLCDEDVYLAYKTNARPSSLLAQLARKYSFKYIYISTDGYYTGDKNISHAEEDQLYFINEYARTKFVGEAFALTNQDSLVIRTNIVGFKGDKDNLTFLEWCIDALKNEHEMTLFDDYYTSSISVTQFSKILFDLEAKNACGIINIACSEVFSKKEFIETLAEYLGLPLHNTKVGSVKNLLDSIRAESLGLSVKKAEKILGYSLPNLQEVLMQIKSEYDHDV